MEQKESILSSEHADFIYTPNSGGLFILNDSASMKVKSKLPAVSADKVENTTVAPDLARVTGEFAKWGDDNLKPQTIKALIASSFVLKSGFAKRYRQAFSNGIITKVWKESEGGEDILIRKRVPEFQEFLKRNGYGKKYTMQVIKDLLRFQISFPEFVTSVDKSKILQIKAQKAIECRFSIQNADGLSERCFISADWAQTRDVSDTTKVKSLPIVHDSYFAIEEMKLATESNFMYPVCQAMDEGYYPDLDWLSDDVYDLVDISTSWAKFVKHLMKNASIINYLVFIKDWYWPARFGDAAWEKLTPAEKSARKKTEIENINKNITGVEKAGKMLLIDVKTKLQQALKIAGVGDLDKFSNAWDVKVLEQPKTDQTFLESFNSANRSLQHAIQLDSSSYGSLSGEGDKGGSDKQQGYNISLIADEYIRQLIIQPFEFIRDYNGWSPEIEFDFDLPVMQTMAAIPPKDRNIQPSK